VDIFICRSRTEPTISTFKNGYGLKRLKPFKEYFVGKLFIRYAWDMIVDVHQFQKISAHGNFNNILKSH